MAWIAVFGLLLAAFVVVYVARKHSRGYPVSTPTPLEPTASVIVDTDDALPAEIDFDSGIEAGQGALEARKPKGD
ncbi:hypothetical protein [Calidithermus timidus]|jgi:hypothetical protein|uniref:hypothetical protein n=1 Tax=Calidithermus timidus TaxID=307124 RepID=UPI0003675FE5|nr:hypothetical protein [Calidithermus timidus]